MAQESQAENGIHIADPRPSNPQVQDCGSSCVASKVIDGVLLVCHACMHAYDTMQGRLADTNELLNGGLYEWIICFWWPLVLDKISDPVSLFCEVGVVGGRFCCIG